MGVIKEVVRVQVEKNHQKLLAAKEKKRKEKRYVARHLYASESGHFSTFNG
jgi:hypothetical protein